MFNPAYLLKSRNAIFYLRWPIPKQLHPQRAASSLKLSLGTRCPQQALRLARSLSEMGYRINEHGITSGMKYEEIRAVLRKHFGDGLDNWKARILETGRLTPDSREAFENGVVFAEESVAKKWPVSFMETNDDPLLSGFIARYDLDIQKGTRQYDQLQDELRVSWRDFQKAVLAFDSEFDQYDFPTPGITGGLSAPVPGPQSLTIKAIATAYTAEKKRAGSWVSKTESEKTEHISLLTEMLGDAFQADSLGPLDAKRVKDALLILPKNRSKNPLTRGKPLADVLGMKGVETIHITTINKYLQTFNDLFEWARKQGHVAENRFSGLTIRRKKGQGAGDRKAFEPTEVKAMISALTGGRVGLVPKLHHKWGALIGIYTGARLNEIAQLEVKDICQADGIWCFNINDEGDDKHVKTVTSKRLVPIHHELKRLGFMEFVDNARTDRRVRLFPAFTYSAQNGWGRTLGRWFNESFLPAMEMKSPQHVFHSLRHTAVTQLMRTGLEEPIVKALVGHAQQGVTQQNYFKQGYTILQLNNGIQRLSFGTEHPQI